VARGEEIKLKSVELLLDMKNEDFAGPASPHDPVWDEVLRLDSEWAPSEWGPPEPAGGKHEQYTDRRV